MSGSLIRSLITTSIGIYKPNATNFRPLHTATVSCAARKGTRAKARAKKVKVEVTKVGFVPHNQRGKNKLTQNIADKHQDDSHKIISKDDVYPMRYYRWVVYGTEEAVRCHQETHHPTMYNVPDALLYAKVELNMLAAKKTRTVENFTRLALLPHGFPRDEDRTILAFCKGQQLVQETLAAGATTVGGPELVKKIQEGELRVADFDYVVAHPGMLTELVPVRGLLKRRFPSPRAGTLDVDLPALVTKLAKGVQFKAVKDDHQPNYGSVEVPVGRLNMPAKEVAENIAALLQDIQSARPKRDGLFITRYIHSLKNMVALLQDIQSARPKRDGLFITRCFLRSPPSSETLKIDPFAHVARELDTAAAAQHDSDDEDDQADAAAAAAAAAN